MKALFLILLCLSSFANEIPSVVLITSVETPKIWYRANSWQVEESLEKIFYKAFKNTDYNLVVVNKATPSKLRKVLKDPSNIAVFWVSHATGALSVSKGLRTSNMIVDLYHNDVTKLFSDIHPNMKFLGLIGCNAKGVIQNFNSKNFYAQNKDLKLHSFSDLVDARDGLKKSIIASESKLGILKERLISAGRRKRKVKSPVFHSGFNLSYFNISDKNNDYSNLLKLRIKRFSRNDVDEALILVNGKAYEYLPPISSGEVQEREIYVSNEILLIKKKLEITIESMRFTNKNKQELGRLDISSSLDGNFELFAKRDGTPLGIRSNLYTFTRSY